MPTRYVHRFEFRIENWSTPIAALLGFVAGAAMMLLAMSGAVAEEAVSDDANRMMMRPLSQSMDGETPTRPHNAWMKAPLVATAATLDVGGFVVRGTVRQIFQNDSSDWVEGVYKFPLPPDAAVDTLSMKVGDRIIKGLIDEKQAARQSYETARAEGKASSLLEQERPNLFTISVANIPPNALVEVDLGYQATAKRDGDQFELRVPTVAAPRYVPPMPLAGSEHPALRDIERDIVHERTATAFPIDPTGRRNPIAFVVHLSSGVPLASLESPTHELSVVQEEENRYQITLRRSVVPADRDFVLRWRTERGAAPATALFKERVGLDDYLLMMVMPPDRDTVQELDLPRDVTFIVDTSSSMHGAAMSAAKDALAHALDRLTPKDLFDIVEFNDRTSRLFGSGRRAEAGAIDAGLRFTAMLDADGGTDMAPALHSALRDTPADAHVRQVVFLTDGLVGNEEQLFNLIDRHLGSARLFTVGLGPAPNGWFMEKAATVGRGRTIQIASLDKAGARLAGFYDGLSAPVATELVVGSELTEVESFPARLPDLYGEEPVVAVMKIDDTEEAGVDGVSLMGTGSSGIWSKRLKLAHAVSAPGIAKLWAHAKVDDIMDRKRRGQIGDDEARMAVLDIALPHGITSKYTSLVAIDATPIRPAAEDVVQTPVPNNIPHGWTDRNIGGQHHRAHAPPLPAVPAGVPANGTSPAPQASLAVVHQASLVRIGGPAGALGWPATLGIGIVMLTVGIGMIATIRVRTASGRHA